MKQNPYCNALSLPRRHLLYITAYLDIAKRGQTDLAIIPSAEPRIGKKEFRFKFRSGKLTQGKGGGCLISKGVAAEKRHDGQLSSQFRSVVGSLAWIAPQALRDLEERVSRLQSLREKPVRGALPTSRKRFPRNPRHQIGMR